MTEYNKNNSIEEMVDIPKLAYRKPNYKDIIKEQLHFYELGFKSQN